MRTISRLYKDIVSGICRDFVFISRVDVRRLLTFLRGYGKESFLAPAFKMLEAIFELLVPIAVTFIIDKGINAGRGDYVWLMCGVMILLAVVGLASALCAQYFAARAAVGFATKLRSALFAKIQSFSHSVTDRIGISTLITRMTGDINSVQTGVNMFLRLFMRSPFVVFGSMICAFIISPRIGVIFALTIALLSIIIFGIMLINIAQQKKTQACLDGVVAKVRENFHGTRVVRAFGKQDEEVEEFGKRIDTLKRFQVFSGRISALLNPVTYIIVNIAVILLIRVGAISVSSGELTQGQVVALYNYMSQILVELVKLASLIITLNRAAASASRISAILDTPSDIEFTADEASRESDDAVIFDSVSFSYSKNSPDSEDAVCDIEFTVKAGQTVGIIGGTGSGKSTLASLISGFYHATRGAVFINGKNASLLDKNDIKQLFGIVPQRSTLFKGTVRSNLAWGKETATDNEMWEALSLAAAKDFVEQKEGGLDAPVSAEGKNFSGGQRQRLTIARALIKKPQILILDDSASALDYATESELRRNISSLDYKPTVFIISQRTSSIMHADLILVLDDGRLCGKGRHDELLQSCELYREIYNTQFSGGEAQ